MQVGTLTTEWPWGDEFAAEILRAIHILATSTTKRMDLPGDVKIYKAGSIIRIDIPDTNLM